MGISVTEPSVEPVSVAEAKAHLRVTASDDDTYIGNLIKAARQRAEAYMNRSIVTQVVTYTLDALPSEIILPRAPVQSVTSIQYVDDNGSTQSFTVFQADLTNAAMPMVKPAYGYSWPSTRDQYGAVTVTYTAGYGGGDSPDTSSSIPEPIRQAILLMVGTMYEYREEIQTGAASYELPMTAKHLLHPYRVAIV